MIEIFVNLNDKLVHLQIYFFWFQSLKAELKGKIQPPALLRLTNKHVFTCVNNRKLLLLGESFAVTSLPGNPKW